MSLEAQMKIALVLSAYDRASAQINNFVNKAQSKLKSFAKSADNIAEKSFKTGQQLVASGIAIGAPLVSATKKAMDFEEAMADVAKVMNMQNGSAELRAMGTEAQKLGIYLGRGSVDAAKLMANLAQGGAEKVDLARVSKIAGEMGVAFDLTAEIAGDKFMKLKNALGISIDETKEAADAMNMLSDKTAAKASQILDFMSAGGASVAKTLQLSAPDIQAFGAAMIEMGKSGEETATIMQRFQKGVLSDEKFRSIFLKAGGGKAGLLAVLREGAGIKNQTKQFEFFKKFGEYGTAVQQFANNYGRLNELTKLTANRQSYANSVNAEFNNRMNTTAGRLGKVKAQAEVVAIKLGETLLPIINKLIDKITPLIERFQKWVERNPGLVKGIMVAVAAFSSMAIVGGYLSFVVGGVARFFGIASSAISGVSKVMRIVMPIIRAVWTLLKLNPIMAIITILILLASIIFQNWNKIKATVLNFINTISTAVSNTWNKIVDTVSNIFAAITAPIRQAWDWLTNKINDFKEAGRKIIQSIIDGIKNMLDKPVNLIKNLVGKIRKFLPFSPAKEGPLKDIHRIRLVETIAESIKPKSLIDKVHNVAKLTMGAFAKPVSGIQTTGAGYGGSFNVTINLTGGATKQDAALITAEIKKHFAVWIRQYQNNKDRVTFNQ